jgi:adenine-specific DNA glycosylase
MLLPKYARWLEYSFHALAAAPERDVARNVVSAQLQHPAEAPAVSLARRWSGGDTTADEETLLSFKGISAYGRAIQACIPEQAAILDTNVARVQRLHRRKTESHAMTQHLWKVSERSSRARRLRLQSGADGLWGDGLPARSQVSLVPDGPCRSFPLTPK